MAGLYVSEPIKLDTGEGHLFVTIEGQSFVIPWHIVLPALREVNILADQFDADGRGKVVPFKMGCAAGH